MKITPKVLPLTGLKQIFHRIGEQNIPLAQKVKQIHSHASALLNPIQNPLLEHPSFQDTRSDLTTYLARLQRLFKQSESSPEETKEKLDPDMSLASSIVQGIVNTWQTEGEFRMEEVKDQTGKVELLRKRSTKHVLSRDGEVFELRTVENIDPQIGLPSEAEIALTSIDDGQVKSNGKLLYPASMIGVWPLLIDLETPTQYTNRGLGTLIVNEAIELATKNFPDCPYIEVDDLRSCLRKDIK